MTWLPEYCKTSSAPQSSQRQAELKRRDLKIQKLRDEIVRLARSAETDRLRAPRDVEFFLHNNDLVRYGQNRYVGQQKLDGSLSETLSADILQIVLPAPEDDSYDWS